MACPSRLVAVLVLTLRFGLPEQGAAAERDVFWSAILSDPRLSSPALMLSLFSYRGEAGLQLAHIARQAAQGSTGFNLGLGYDDMVLGFQNVLDGSPLPPPITERLFLLHTGCDKRFQLTFQITW